MALVASGKANINTLVTQYTGTNLITAIGAATVGTLDAQSSASLSIQQVVDQPVGAGDPTSFTFPVYLTTTSTLTAPVTVQYKTMDDTATAANGDYVPVSGTLTWKPGDTGPQMITVPVNVTNSAAPNQNFEVLLSNGQNATINKALGFGVIEYTDYGTTTTLTSTDLSPSFGDSVTLTAIVTNQDPAKSAGTGTVTFSQVDGTVIGTATLVNGQASLVTTNLPTGSDFITAVYNGAATTAAKDATSTSAPLVEAVESAAQTITFGSLANQTYGALPFIVSATASSGLDVSYQIVSGPASLSDNLLSITGAGTVVVEASQPGSLSFAAAPSVQQSFEVAPAPLNFLINDQSMVYGSKLPTFTGSFDPTGFIIGDTAADVTTPPTLTTTATSGSAAGSYAITGSGAVVPNYTIIYMPGTLTVTPALLTVIPNHQTMTYGGALPNWTFTYSGFVNGDTAANLSASPTVTTVPANSHVGTYAIVATGEVSGYYVVQDLPGTLTITPAPLAITANNQVAALGGAYPTLTASYSGFVNGDSVASLTASPTLTTVPAGTGAGTYPIDLSGGFDRDYAITDVPGTLTISTYGTTTSLSP